jgi:hypothetical protein
MRSLALLLAAFFAASAPAQPVRDEAGVAAAFELLVALAHAGEVEAALPTVACPAEGGGGRVAVPCDGALAAHRARAEWQLGLLRHLFPEDSVAFRPHYAVSRGDQGGVHHLLFEGLDAAPFALLVFVDTGDGVHRLADVQLGSDVDGVPPPPTLVAALEALLAAAGDEATSVEAFTPLVVARGGDEARAWKAPADPAREDERRYVAGLLDSLRALLAMAEGHTVVGFEARRESEGWWHTLRVAFEGPGEPPTLSFAFLPVGPAFLLGDVDVES